MSTVRTERRAHGRFVNQRALLAQTRIELLLGTVAFAGIGMLMAGTLRAEANLALSNGLFLALLFLGGMAYPLTKLPGALQAVAKVLPAAPLAETVRDVVDGSKSFPVGM